jgi:NADH:ubiquinone oxidoreductase subunit
VKRLNLSKDSRYAAHADCIAKRDYAGAAEHFKAVLRRARSMHCNDVEIGFLITSIGKVKYWGGEKISARRYFARADKATGQAALTRLIVAEFYLEFTDVPEVGAKWLRKLRDSAPNPADRFDRRWRKRAQKLLAEAEGAKT